MSSPIANNLGSGRLLAADGALKRSGDWRSEDWGSGDWSSEDWNPAAAGELSAESPESSSFWTQVILCILLMRSALDLYSGKGVPAIFAIAVDLFVCFFIARQFILRRPVHTDRFWWLLMAWVALQGIWVALLPTGALGGTAFMAYEAMREWVRFLSLGLVYLLTMQLRDRISPPRLISILMLSLVIPLFLAALQISQIDLPGFLQSNVGWKDFEGTGDRINSTLGHYNSFATFTLLFMALTLWHLQMSRRPVGWAILLACLLYCLVATKSLTGLVMLMVFGALYFFPRLKGKGFFGALALVVALGILLSTELGRERLMELNKTPLLNPDITFHEAAVLQAADITEFRNSFNWRLLQWQDLLSNWRLHPWLGYGLASTKKLSVFNTTSHNDYLRFLIEGGVVGFSLFLAFVVAQVMRTLQIIRRTLPGTPQRALAQTLFPFSVALMVGMMVGNVMVHTATFFYWWVLLAVLGWDWPERLDGAIPVEELAVSERRARKRVRRRAVGQGMLPARDRLRVPAGASLLPELSVSDQTDTPLIADESRNVAREIEGPVVARPDMALTTELIEYWDAEDDSLQAFDSEGEVDLVDLYDAISYDEDIYASDRYDLDSDI